MSNHTPSAPAHWRLMGPLLSAMFILGMHWWTALPAQAQGADPTFVLQTTLPVDDDSNAIMAGDLNGDGSLDLIVGNNGQNYFYLNNGQGSFDLPMAFGSPSNTADIGLGDIDNNGTLDLIVYNVGAQSEVYVNDGTGTLQLGSTFGSAADVADRVTLGDLDGDGDYDLVAARKSGSTSIYMNNGQGTFQETRTLPAGLNPVLLDVDKNGSLDIGMIQVTPNQPAQSTLYHFLNNGSGNFTSKRLTLSGGKGFNNSFAMGDIDGDGDLDYVISSLKTSGCAQQGCENLRLMLNRGLLGYAAITLDDAGANHITLTDLDNDGDLDIATSGVPADTALANDRQAKAYLNKGIIQLLGSATFTIKEIGTAQTDAKSLAVADYNADGQIDIAVGGTGFNSIHQSRNGAFFSSCQTNLLLLDTELVADINGDAYLDIVLKSGLILQNNRAGNFTPLITLPLVLNAASHIAAADMNGDGRLDLITVHGNARASLFLQGQGGQFSAAIQLDNNSFPATSLATGDIDGDGDLDLLIGMGTPAGSGSATAGQNRIYMNNGSAQFTQVQTVDDASDDTQAVALGDLDADGDLDIIVANSAEAANDQQGRQNYVYFNDGNGHFLDKRPVGTGADRTRSIGVGDVNNDGNMDIVFANYAQLNGVYLNDGSGGFADSQLLGQFFDNTAIIHLVDIDQDRDLDIIAANEKQSDATYINNGKGQFTASVTYNESLADARIFTLQTGDFDRDGDLDILADVQELSLIPYLIDCILDGRLAPSSQTSNRPPKIVMQQPGNSVGAGPYASPQIFEQGEIPLTFSLFDPDARPADIDAYYSLDGGGQWFPAAPTSDTATHSLSTKNGSGSVTHTFKWDVYASNFLGMSDLVLVRIEARPSLRPRSRQVSGPYRFPNSAVQTFPIRVRGTQVRVVNAQGAPVAGAEIYRLPAGADGRAELFTTQNERIVRTNNQGYLAGRGVMHNGDQLVALAPVDVTHAFTLYHTSAAPTQTGLDPYVVTGAGIQILTVSAANPLTLFNLDISLEWDARQDGTFLADLQNAIENASDVLFDVSEGQVALGDVQIHQAKENWVSADVILYASNSIHPRASMGGVVITPTVDIGIHGTIENAYLPGQIHMGPHWDPFGQSEAELRQDWWLAFAHELAHYLLFLPDNYLGVREGVLSGIDCQGSFMTNTYEEPYREFLTRDLWDAQDTCRTQSLAAHTTGRADWETIQRFLPWLHIPTSGAATNPGPVQLPLKVTHVQFMTPSAPALVPVLPARNFDLRDATSGEVTRLRQANAYLFKTNGTPQLEDDYVIGLGSTGAGSDRIKVRGSQAGDRLCVVAGATDVTRLGCAAITETSTSIQLQPLDNWQPEITVSPISSRTLSITVIQPVQAGEALHAQVLPAYGSLTQTRPIVSPWVQLQPQDATNPHIFTGIITLDGPAFEGFVRVWLPDRALAHEALTEFYLSPGWGPNARAFGAANSSVWGPNARAFGAANSRVWGAHQRFMNAPVASGDGRVTIFNLDNILGDSGATSLQTLPTLPQAPLWLSNVGQAYRFTADRVEGLAQTIAFQYLEREAPKGYEHTLTVYYLADGDTEWQRLSTYLDSDENLAAARMPQNDVQSQGVYALMATVEMPALRSGWNHVGYPIPQTRPVANALASLNGAYTAVYQYEPASTPAWRLYDPAVPQEHPEFTALVNDLDVLATNHVYWLHATEAITPYLAVGSANPGDTVAASALADSAELPPTTLFGPFDPAGIVTPTANMTIIATIQGVECGQGQLYQLNNQWVYKLQVTAAVQKNGCGATGESINLAVSGQAIAETPIWDNRKARYQPVTVTLAGADTKPNSGGGDNAKPDDKPEVNQPVDTGTSQTHIYLPTIRK